MQKRDSNLLMATLGGWLLLLSILTTCDAHAGERADYVAEQMAAMGIPAGVVPVDWVRDERLRKIAGTPWNLTTYGLTSCGLYPDAETGRHFVRCRIYLNRTAKLAVLGGWRDTVRHELCHVLVASSVAGTIPAEWSDAEVSERFEALTDHGGKYFVKCALRHDVRLDADDLN